MVKGFGFIDKKLAHFERNMPEKIAKDVSVVFESKMKSYVNNLMTTTIEGVVRKQFESMGSKIPPLPVPIPMPAGNGITFLDKKKVHALFDLWRPSHRSKSALFHFESKKRFARLQIYSSGEIRHP